MRIDLNADVGESFGIYRLGADAALVPLITSANVACGFHAGDPGVMRATAALARRHGVAIGAHPALPDLAGFGRREVRLSPREVEDLVLYQIGALAGVAAAEGLALQHVKPHGALFTMAARERPLADAIAAATAAIGRHLVLFGPPASELVAAGRRAGLRTACEGFADRAYRPDGTLVPRGEPGAIVRDAGEVAARALCMVQERAVVAIDGSRVPLEIDTLCVHGDTPDAPDLARCIRDALAAAGVAIKAVGSP